MRKKNVFIITLILIILISTIVHANSGPTYWEGFPSSDILSIDENSPIIVEKEDLIFDFSKDEFTDQGSHSISGLVTAIYKMSNPTDNKQSVQMAFPIISSLESFNPDDIIIKEDERIIPFEVHIGDEVGRKGKQEDSEEEKLDFNSIVKSISNEIYSPHNFKLDEVGTLYTYDVKTTSEKDVNFVIDFIRDHEKTKIISDGFNRYEEHQGKYRIASWIYEKESLEIFVVGDDIDFNISAFTNGELTLETDAYSYEIKTEKISIKDFISKEVKKYLGVAKDKDYLSDNQLFNLYSKELDEILGHNVGYIWKDDFLYLDFSERIIVLLYEVDFSELSTNDISVSYVTRGTMDKTSTVDPLYTFEYILNPAKNWAAFENLNIEIRTPNEHPYVVDSSVDLIRNEDGIYTGFFASLPEKDLSFTLYSKEEITLLDKVEKHANDLTPFFQYLGRTIGVILIFKIISILFSKVRKKSL